MQGLAFAAVLPCILLPIYNPDLFWHLSAARRMVELRGIPDSDWLSSTMPGAHWTDFEWGAQLLYWAFNGIAGMSALWLLKAALVGCVGFIVGMGLRMYQAPTPYAAAAMAVWSAGFLARSDIRPDLFTVLGFGTLFLWLEGRRLGSDPRMPAALWMIPFFSLWANLHAGFPYGLILIGFYALGEHLEKVPALCEDASGPGFWRGHSPFPQRSGTLWPCLAAGFAGTLLQPAGPKMYGVLWEHLRDMDLLSHRIFEWYPLEVRNPWHWPYWAILFLGFSATLAGFLRTRKIGFGPLAALLYFGLSGSQHVRLGAYYAVIAPLLTYRGLQRSGRLPSPDTWGARVAAAVLILLCGVYGIWWGQRFGLFRTVFHTRFVPQLSAEFLVREREVLAGHPLYHRWGWGGYLGWRLYPDFKVFEDGRYIFHPLLREVEAAQQTPALWQTFLDRRRIDIALMSNMAWRWPTTRVYPDGSKKSFQRPYYAIFMPKDRWALVHWDTDTLLFVRRSALPADWLRIREFRYALPFDEEARGDVLARGEIPAPAVEAEFRRHEALLRELAQRVPRM